MQADTSSVRHFVAINNHQLVPLSQNNVGTLRPVLESYWQVVYSVNFLPEALPTKVFGTKDKILNAMQPVRLLPLSHFTEAFLSGQFRATCGFLVDAGWSQSSTGWR